MAWIIVKDKISISHIKVELESKTKILPMA